MPALRALLRSRPALVAWLLVCALAMKVVIPAGFMPIASSGSISVAVCNGMGPITIHIPGLPDKPDHTAKDQPCAYAGLSAPMLGGADATLLIAAILFAFVAAIVGASPALVPAPTRLRPPLRGPPARG